MIDCAIVGGGPAGLGAALVLGRAGRSVALIDDNRPRNGVTRSSHGFLTRDGVRPDEFRRIAYEEVLKYPSVEHWQEAAVDIYKQEGGFGVITQTGEQVQAKKLIIAAGLKEIFPEIKGLQDFYGKSLFNCPYCDGWEWRDQPIFLLSEDPSIFHMAKLLYHWSQDLIVCTNGKSVLSTENQKVLESKNIRIIETPVVAFEGQNGMLEQVILEDGRRIERSGGFVIPKWEAKVDFLKQLEYAQTEFGGIATDAMGRSTVAGLYAAGDTAYVRPSQLIYAAADGHKVGIAVNTDLTEEAFA
ncbi:NAD(P)/FAD-dependent oxidoreductase [uncultured Brevibacillus sp.]|uniref:NAD(P)/FAD-dependent oxidoreductase n=1 Tax=uncultured Brevibacillus sp. TaxID=169970 RepID=UPI0025954A1C|nr:NAD(P)/FAD-dependent oxidoreductase [uncultured Brevibacillus sp.]